jgi:seryl-tRNA synthetase
MIDIRRLRNEPDVVKAALGRRGIDLGDLDRALALDERQRAAAGRRDDVRARIKILSKQVGKARGSGATEEAEKLQADSRALGEEEKTLDTEADAAAGELREILLRVPNLPDAAAPDGASEDDNPVLRVVGLDENAYTAAQRVPHWETGAALGMLDLERGAKISGSMFPVYRGDGARLARALVQFGLTRNGDAYEEVRPPTLVTSETLTATGQLPKFADDAYHVERDDLWAIPTAEVPLTSLYRNEILDEAELPKRLMAHTSCYRREAGSAGRDTRGLLRVHEFDKVEILGLCTPDQAQGVLDDILGRAEGAIAALGLAYRVLEICTGDLGQSHARSFDIEVYAPGCDKWLEVSSCSWFSDYQARRANLRYRPAGGGSPHVLHTLNGSALAVPRVWAALVETYRQDDGTIAVPDVLRPFLGGAATIGQKQDR